MCCENACAVLLHFKNQLMLMLSHYAVYARCPFVWQNRHTGALSPSCKLLNVNTCFEAMELFKSFWARLNWMFSSFCDSKSTAQHVIKWFNLPLGKRFLIVLVNMELSASIWTYKKYDATKTLLLCFSYRVSHKTCYLYRSKDINFVFFNGMQKPAHLLHGKKLDFHYDVL